MAMGARQSRQGRFSSPDASWPIELGVETDSLDAIGRLTDPMAAEVMDHLRNARVSLQRLGTAQTSLTNGPAFPHFEEANRSIHSALIALDECRKAL